MQALFAPLLLTATIAPGAGVLAASPEQQGVDLAAERAAIEQFQRVDQRLQDIGWQLVRGNAAFCHDTLPAVGLQLHDLASYGRPDIARAALGMRGDFAVQTAAKGSPADTIGGFLPNREITSIGSVDPNRWDAGEKRDWRRLKRAHDEIDATLNRTGELTVRFGDGEQARLTPVVVCATRFELAAEGKRAVADGERVVIGVEFAGFAYSQELLAAAIAHELAHNFLAHREWLDRNGRKRRNIRATEREADRLMPWLLANAGYDPAAALLFFEQYQPSSGAMLFIPGSHDKWQKRFTAVQSELPRIAQLVKSTGEADWSTRFTREIDPAKGL